MNVKYKQPEAARVESQPKKQNELGIVENRLTFPNL